MILQSCSCETTWCSEYVISHLVPVQRTLNLTRWWLTVRCFRPKNHNHSNKWSCEVMCRIKYVFSPMVKDLSPLILARWWLTTAGFYSESHMTLCGNVIFKKKYLSWPLYSSGRWIEEGGLELKRLLGSTRKRLSRHRYLVCYCCNVVEFLRKL